MAGRLAGPRAAACRAPAGRGLRRQSRRRRARASRPFPAAVTQRDGREFRRRRRRDQPDLRDLRPRSRSSNSRSTCRPATSPKGRRSTRRACAATMAFGMEAIAGGVDLLWRSARWASATPRSRPRSTRRSTAAPAARLGRPRHRASTMRGWRARPPRSRRAVALPSRPSRRSARSAAPRSAGARSPRSPARSSRRARSASRSSSTASS